MKIISWVIGCGLAASFCFAAFSEETGGEYLHYRLGIKYKTDRQYDKAIEEFRKVLAEYPDNYNVYMHVAEIRMAQGQSQFAVSNLKQALAYNPGWGKAHKMLAYAYEKENLLKKAIGEYQVYQQACDPAERDSVQKVIERLVANVGTAEIPDDVETPEGKRRTLSAGQAKQRTTAAATPANSKAADAFSRAVQAYGRHEYDTSLKLLRQVINAEPGFAGAYYYGGLIRYELGHTKLAKINFSKSKTYIEPEYAGLICRAKIAAAENKFGEAVGLLSRYVNATSSDVGKKEATSLLAKYRSLADAVEKSRGSESGSGSQGAGAGEQDDVSERSGMEVRIDSLLSMVTVDTLSDAGQKLLAGIKEFQTGRYDRAIKEFKKTMAVYPTGTVAVQCIYNCGICYFKLRLLKEAENQFQQIRERYSRHELAAQSLFLKALTYSERTETTVAERLFREFLTAYPTHSWQGKAWEKLGDVYVDLEQHKKAIDAFAKASAVSVICGDQVSSLFKMGSGYLLIGNPARAFGCFDSAISRGERCNGYVRVPDSYYRIADEQYKRKLYREALAYYTKVTRKYPSFQETPWGLFQIGNIHKNLREYQKAIGIYKELIRRFPDDYWTKQAQWKLDDAVWEHEYQTTLH